MSHRSCAPESADQNAAVLRLLEEAHQKLDVLGVTADSHTESLQRIETHMVSLDSLFHHFVMNRDNNRGVSVIWIVALAAMLGFALTLLLT